MTLNVGDPAPTFTLPDGDGNTINLTDLQGKWVVLYFYPRDNTPGCTKEACSFRDVYDTYKSKDVVVLGMNTDDAKAHSKFSTKYNLPFPLLTDPDGAVATAYESYGKKKMMGKEFLGIFRKTFIIDPEGKIAKIYPKVKPEAHAEEVLADLEALMAE